MNQFTKDYLHTFTANKTMQDWIVKTIIFVLAMSVSFTFCSYWLAGQPFWVRVLADCICGIISLLAMHLVYCIILRLIRKQ
ncbi:MAG: hypothetical protein KBS99_07825 [Prevotellaceae bacterium]|nr:hypothetical protein [Candidatus Colivivens caballi]